MSSHWTSAVGDMLRAVLLFIPKALLFVLILVAGWFIAKAVRKLVDKVLERVGFDRVVERGGVKAALARSKYDASDLVAKLVFYAILLLTLQIAFGIWGPNPVSDLISAVVAWLPRAFVAIVIVVVAAAIARAVKDIITGALGGLSYGRALGNVASVFILGLGVIAALNQIGVATSVTTPVLIAVLATIAGVLIVGVGGGLVGPMQRRWESWLTRAEQEAPVIAEHARNATPTAPAPAPTPAAAPDTTPVATPVFADTAADATQPVQPAVTQPAATQPAATQPAPSDVTQPVRPVIDEPTMVIPPVDPGRK
jgi:Flp pilus assembly pilin Flp